MPVADGKGVWWGSSSQVGGCDDEDDEDGRLGCAGAETKGCSEPIVGGIRSPFVTEPEPAARGGDNDVEEDGSGVANEGECVWPYKDGLNIESSTLGRLPSSDRRRESRWPSVEDRRTEPLTRLSLSDENESRPPPPVPAAKLELLLRLPRC